jgi:hypothetical protein
MAKTTIKKTIDKPIPAEQTMPEIMHSCRACGASGFFWNKRNICDCGQRN